MSKLFNKIRHHYFIWEKPSLHNKGISIKLTTSKVCYILPTMCGVIDSFSKTFYDRPPLHFMLHTEKTIYWLWFRLTFKTEIKREQ